MTEKTEDEQARLNEAVHMRSALSSLRTLVEQALGAEPPDFLKAKRICEVAEHLKLAIGRKVQDFAGADFMCDDAAMEAGQGQGVRIGRIGGGMEDLTRVLVGLLDRQVGQRSVVDTARSREIEALELESLLKLEPMTQASSEHGSRRASKPSRRT